MKTATIAMVVVVWVGLGGCASQQKVVDGEETKESLTRLTEKAELIIVARVLKIGPAPSFWSGYILAKQKVEYEILEVLKRSL